jgi:rRNA maturation protein Nop10
MCEGRYNRNLLAVKPLYLKQTAGKCTEYTLQSSVNKTGSIQNSFIPDSVPPRNSRTHARKRTHTARGDLLCLNL